MNDPLPFATSSKGGWGNLGVRVLILAPTCVPPPVLTNIFCHCSMAVANSSFFSLTEEDDLILPSPQHSPLKEQDLGRGTSPGKHSFVEISLNKLQRTSQFNSSVSNEADKLPRATCLVISLFNFLGMAAMPFPLWYGGALLTLKTIVLPKL